MHPFQTSYLYRTAETARSCHFSVFHMSQTEEFSTKRVFGVFISYDDVVGKLLLDFLAGLTVFSLITGLSYIWIIFLLQELTVFPFMSQVSCTSMGLLRWVPILDRPCLIIHYDNFEDWLGNP